MSISSKRLQELTEEKIGQGKSKYLFGREWELLYEVIGQEESDLTEEMFMEVLGRCNFKDPERVGLISMICPPLCTYITDRVMGRIMRDLYKVSLYLWYFLFIEGIIQSLVEWKLDNLVLLMILCLVITSWCFRGWSRDYNKLEFLYHTLDVTGKIDRVMKRREE